MGTRSAIAVMHGDKAKAVYCHWDGYLEHNGAILQEHYDSVKANQLVSLGDLSSLKQNIGVQHAFSTFELTDEQQAAYEVEHGDSCTFYGRDRGETGTEFKTFASYDALREYFDGSGAEYYYIMKDGVWYYSTYKDAELKLLADGLANLKESEVECAY